MDKKTKRVLLFSFGCIVARLCIVYIAKEVTSLQFYLSLIAIIIGIRFIYLYFYSPSLNQFEVLGIESVWWNHMRPIHGLLYLSYGILTLYQVKNTWILLLVDVIIGIISTLYNEFI